MKPDQSWESRYIKTGALTSDALKVEDGGQATPSRAMLDCYYTHTVDYCDKQAASSVAGQKSHVKAASLQPYDMDCFYHHTVDFCEALKAKNQATQVLNNVEPSHRTVVPSLPPVQREPSAAASVAAAAAAAAPRPVVAPAARAAPNPDAAASAAAAGAPITWAKHAENEEEQQQRAVAAAKVAVHAAASSKKAASVAHARAVVPPAPAMTSAQRDSNALRLAEGLGGGGGGGASMGSVAVSLAKKEAAQREDVKVGPRAAAIPEKKIYTESISAESQWDIAHGVRVIDGSPRVKASESTEDEGVSVAGLERLARMDGLAVIPESLESAKGGEHAQIYAGRNGGTLKAAKDAEAEWEARRKAAVDAYYKGENSALSAGSTDTTSWEDAHGLRSKDYVPAAPVREEVQQSRDDAHVAAAAPAHEESQQHEQEEVHSRSAAEGVKGADEGMMVSAKTGGVQSLSGQEGGGAAGGYSAMLKAHAAAEARWEAEHGLRRSFGAGKNMAAAPASVAPALVVDAPPPSAAVADPKKEAPGADDGAAPKHASSHEGVKKAVSGGGVSKKLVEGAVKEEEGLGAAGVEALGFSSPSKFEKHLEKEGV